MQIQSIFPVPMAEIKERSPTKDELSFIKSLKTHPNIGNKTSVDTHVLDREELSDLKTVIQKHVDSFFRGVLKVQTNCSLRITQSWCNYGDSRHYHHKHKHPNSAISGVYYPQAEHKEDSINFYSPLDLYNTTIMCLFTEANPFNSPGYSVRTNTGTLLLFPSWLEHEVEPVEERTSTRISLSFNTFYTGTVGDERSLTELNLGE